MKNKRFTGLIASMATALLLLSMLAGVPVMAAEKSQSNSGVIVANSGGSPSAPVTSGVEVTGYRLYSVDANNQEHPINTIGANTDFWIDLTVSDARLVTNSKGESDLSKFNKLVEKPSIVKVNINSTAYSFASSDVAFIVEANANEQTYKIKIPVHFNGKDDIFACDIFYTSFPEFPLFSYSAQFRQAVPTTSNMSDSNSDSTSTITRGTGFVLKSASYGASDVPAGQSFNLDAILLSTNGTYPVENVSVSLVLPKEISLVSGNSINYVGTVKPNQSVPVTMNLLASAVAEEGSYKVTVNISGVNAKDGTDVTASMDISIPVVQPERFEISNAVLPDFLSVGMEDGSGYSSITLVNKGKGIIYNVSAEVVGEGLSAQEGNQFIGNIAAGGQNSADFNILATQGGQLEGQLVVTYENAKGEGKTLTKDFTVTAEENMIDPDINSGMSTDPILPEQTGISGWVWLLIGVGVVAVILVVIVVVVRKKKAKKAAELEEDLENDEQDDFD